MSALGRHLALAYAAGLVDGEGCIGIYPNSHNGNYQLRITVEMVERPGLEMLAELFGGRWYHKTKLAPRRDCWVWMVFGSKAATALREMLPYLRVKRKQAEAALQADWDSFAGRVMRPEQQALRSRVHLTIKHLNARGRHVD